MKQSGMSDTHPQPEYDHTGTFAVSLDVGPAGALLLPDDDGADFATEELGSYGCCHGVTAAGTCHTNDSYGCCSYW